MSNKDRIKVTDGRHIVSKVTDGRHIVSKITDGRHILPKITDGRHILNQVPRKSKQSLFPTGQPRYPCQVWYEESTSREQVIRKFSNFSCFTMWLFVLKMKAFQPRSWADLVASIYVFNPYYLVLFDCSLSSLFMVAVSSSLRCQCLYCSCIAVTSVNTWSNHPLFVGWLQILDI